MMIGMETARMPPSRATLRKAITARPRGSKGQGPRTKDQGVSPPSPPGEARGGSFGPWSLVFGPSSTQSQRQVLGERVGVGLVRHHGDQVDPVAVAALLELRAEAVEVLEIRRA